MKRKHKTNLQGYVDVSFKDAADRKWRVSVQTRSIKQRTCDIKTAGRQNRLRTLFT